MIFTQSERLLTDLWRFFNLHQTHATVAGNWKSFMVAESRYFNSCQRTGLQHQALQNQPQCSSVRVSLQHINKCCNNQSIADANKTPIYIYLHSICSLLSPSILCQFHTNSHHRDNRGSLLGMNLTVKRHRKKTEISYF